MKISNNIPTIDLDFFRLLRAGLRQKVDEPLSETPDWRYIYRLACEQTVQGIVADGIALYKSEYPDIQKNMQGYDEFLNQCAQIIRQNYKINQVQAKVCKLLTENGIDFFVVKGQEAAKNYPKPMLRCSGDIDILVPKDQFDATREILRTYADRSEGYNAYLVHDGFFFGDIEVEVHGALHPRLGDIIDIHLDKLQEEMFAGEQTLNTFNAVYIFLHCLQHLHWSGLGIRQVIDLAMLLACTKDIDHSRVQKAIREMKVVREWKLFLHFAHYYLGLPQEVFNTWNLESETLNLKSQTHLWYTCRTTGNMGHNKQYENLTGNFVVRNVKRLCFDFRRYFRLRSLSPHLAGVQLRGSLRDYFKLMAKRYDRV